MSNLLHNEQQFVLGHYNALLAELRPEQEVLVAYNGELSQDSISRLENEIESRTSILDLPKSPLKKIFFISVETLQNMLLHGHRNSNGGIYTLFILCKNATEVSIISGNVVNNTSIQILQRQIDIINSFEDEKSLKTYYLEHLDNNEMSEKGGAGLGFITIAMKSNNKLLAKFHPINEQVSLFMLTCVIPLN